VCAEAGKQSWRDLLTGEPLVLWIADINVSVRPLPRDYLRRASVPRFIRANLFLNNSGEHSLAHELIAPTGPFCTILSVLVSTPNGTSASPISAPPVPVTRAQAWTRTTPPSLPRGLVSIKTRQLHRPWRVYAAGIRSSDAAASCLRVSAAVNRKLHARTHRPQIESA
jgi:hypothetical protein